MNHIALAAARAAIAALPRLKRDGASVLDASAAYFVGISRGHILGASMRQLDALRRPDGRVTRPCDGPCDPE